MTNDSALEGARLIFDLGCAAWPELGLDRKSFEGYLARHAAQGVLPSEAYAPDMFLACACAQRIDRALTAFERTHAPDMARAVATIDASDAFVQEVLQVVRERLLVSRGGTPPKIADYAGRASLKSWLCAVALRAAISLRRRKGDKRHERFQVEEDMRVVERGPEFDYLRRRYKRAFEDAVRSALRRLAPKDRMLLRLNVVDGMSIDKLGALYKVGRSTAARWLAAARNALLEQARRELQEKTRLTSTELDSVAADVQSLLEVSVAKLLARSDAKE
jgi:RNA polymerase sigma-70 factor (ECF subfamily)